MAISKLILNGETQMDVTQTSVAANNLLSGETAVGADGEAVSGGVTSQAAQTIHPSTSDQTIASGKYLAGDQTIKGVTLENLTAENIVSGVTVEIGDSDDSDCVASVTGTASGGGDIYDMSNPTGDISTTQTTLNNVGLRTGVTSVSAPNATILKTCFNGFTALTSVYVPKANGDGYSSDIFYGCTSLTKLALPSWTTRFHLRAVNNCSSLQKFDIKGGSATLNSTNFLDGCSSLNVLILRSTSLLPIGSSLLNQTPFKSGGAGGTIYIPKVLYDELGTGTSSDYKAATNWSTYNGYGTITWAKIEGSYYETHYADDTLIPTS